MQPTMIPETYLNLRIANLEAAKNQALMSLLEHLTNSVSQWHQIEVTQQLQRELMSLLKNLAQNPSAQDRYKNFITAKSESATIVFLSYLSECFAKIPELKQVPPELLSIAEHNFNERIHLLTTQFNEAQLDASQLQSLQIKRKTNQDTQELFKVDEQTQLQAIQVFLNGNNDFDKSLASIKKRHPF
jgi:hypothetical protein